MSQETWRRWLIGLVGAVLNGAASGVLLIVVDPLDFNPFNGGLGKLGVVMGTMGLVGAALYVKDHRLPVE